MFACGHENQQAISQNSKATKTEVIFADNNDSLVNIIINHPPVIYCNEEHHHFVDIIAKEKIDSLKTAGIKSILFYRDWIGTNGLNGYGKLIWSQSGKCYQYQFNFENYDSRYGISSIDKSELQTCDIINFYVEKHIDTVKSNPRDSKIWESHAADHFVYVFIDGKENCFHVSGLNLAEDPRHLKSQLINKLVIPPREYFDMIRQRNQKKKL